MHFPDLASLTTGLRNTLLRFPLPTLFAVLTTGLLVYSVDAGFDDSLLVRFAFLAGLGFVASLLVDLIVEASGAKLAKRIAGQLVMLLLLVGYSSFVMPELLDESDPPFWYSYFILLFALHLGIALVPSLAPDGSRLLWRFNLSSFLRYFFSSVNAALLFGGLALALLSVDKLFELELDGELYGQLWMLCAFLAHPLLFLGGLPRVRELQDEGDFPKALRFTLCFIGLPLVAIYLLILYAYIGKIVLQWSWPNGWVAMPIFILGVISLLTYLLSLPLPKTEAWARLYHRWLFRLLLPLSIVLFLALQVRLGDYGMTINRYLGLALAVWLFGISLAYLIRPALNIVWLPFSLLLVTLLSICAGPLGAFGWSERAQLERLRYMAAELGAIERGILVPATANQEPELVENFQSALRYLLENFGPESLEAELTGFYAAHGPTATTSRRAYPETNRIMEYLELDATRGRNASYFYASRSVLPTNGLDWMIELTIYHYRSHQPTGRFTIDEHELGFTFDQDANQLAIQLDDTDLAAIDLAPWAAEIEAAIRKHGPQNQPALVWQAEAEGWRFSFVCTNAQLNRNQSFQSATFRIFLSPPDERP